MILSSTKLAKLFAFASFAPHSARPENTCDHYEKTSYSNAPVH